jgi:hypothetical protein
MALVAVVVGAASARADVLLTVDLSVTDQVTITATTGLSSATVSGNNNLGVYFENFYGAGSFIDDTLVSGDLTNSLNPSDGSPNLYRDESDPGLNLYGWTSDSGSTVNFTAGVQAFTGSATWDLDSASYNDMLAGNTSGNLYFPADSSDDLATATLIGTWEVASTTVIPTPTAALAIPAMLAGLGLRRRASSAWA